MSAKWTGPWRIVKFTPPALLVIQTTWLGLTGRKEKYREIVIDKLKLFKRPPDSLEKYQLEPAEIPEEDLDEDAVEPTVDPEESRERINHIQCKDDDFSPENLEEEAIYEEKEGDWGTGSVSGNCRPPIETNQVEDQTDAQAAVWGGGLPTL